MYIYIYIYIYCYIYDIYICMYVCMLIECFWFKCYVCIWVIMGTTSLVDPDALDVFKQTYESCYAKYFAASSSDSPVVDSTGEEEDGGGGYLLPMEKVLLHRIPTGATGSGSGVGAADVLSSNNGTLFAIVANNNSTTLHIVFNAAPATKTITKSLDILQDVITTTSPAATSPAAATDASSSKPSVVLKSVCVKWLQQPQQQQQTELNQNNPNAAAASLSSCPRLCLLIHLVDTAASEDSSSIGAGAAAVGVVPGYRLVFMDLDVHRLTFVNIVQVVLPCMQSPPPRCMMVLEVLSPSMVAVSIGLQLAYYSIDRSHINRIPSPLVSHDANNPKGGGGESTWTIQGIQSRQSNSESILVAITLANDTTTMSANNTNYDDDHRQELQQSQQQNSTIVITIHEIKPPQTSNNNRL